VQSSVFFKAEKVSHCKKEKEKKKPASVLSFPYNQDFEKTLTLCPKPWHFYHSEIVLVSGP
jgi:hypothetical protein